MTEEPASNPSSNDRKGLIKALKAVVIFVAIAILLYLLYSTFVSAAASVNDGTIVRWLKSPISDLKIWHLILIVYIVSLLTRKN